MKTDIGNKTTSQTLPLFENGTRPVRQRLPRWLRVPAPGSAGYRKVKKLVDQHSLHTVCEEARCPNIGECWGCGTATFMILGDICTRNCRFCAIASGNPSEYDCNEPERVGEAVATLNLRHAVITSVTRDDLPDGGAEIFAETIRQIRRTSPDTTIEVLIPDFNGDKAALKLAFDERPEILNHNVETVPRLYTDIRPQADYRQSLDVLRRAADSDCTAKTGIMVGLGETTEEIHDVMRDLVDAGCSILTIGQYLRPTPVHVPIARFYDPTEFIELKNVGELLGLKHVESGPLVRSSYHAAEQVSCTESAAD